MALPQSANISRRAWICHLPHPLPPYTPTLSEKLDLGSPSEPTSTIVLTSPSACFVDVRVLKAVDLNGNRLEWAFAGWSESEDLPPTVDGRGEDEDARSPAASISTLVSPPASKPTPLGQTTSNREEKEKTEKTEKTSKPRLDPQLFGISDYTKNTTNKNNDSQATTAVASPESQSSNPRPTAPIFHPTKRMTWHHHVDSRYPIDSPIPADTGLIYPLNDTQTLETGSAVSFPGFPEGSCTNYEELWEDVEICANANASDGGAKRKVCAVLRTEDVTPYGVPVRGTVIRLGQFVQGIIRKGDSVTVERWEFIKDDKNTEATWRRTFRIGEEGMPCAAAQREEDLELGMKIDMLGYEWEVVELVEWV